MQNVPFWALLRDIEVITKPTVLRFSHSCTILLLSFFILKPLF